MKVLAEVLVDVNGAPTEEFRRYEEEPQDRIQSRVRNHYYAMHRNQTVEYVLAKKEKWLKFSHARLTILECLELLHKFLDESDPDFDSANIIHAYQTAESLRKAVPNKPWMHLAGLVHDLGKVMSILGNEAHWEVTGDTYPVGCLPADTIVYGRKSFDGNPDLEDPRYNTRLGMYEEGCGIENLIMAFSHDEYMYQVLKNHPGCTMPEEALYAIRFHSFYPYHQDNEYLHFQSQRDRDLRYAIDELNSCDLYSKHDEEPNIDVLKPYYQSLIDKYIPGVVSW